MFSVRSGGGATSLMISAATAGLILKSRIPAARQTLTNRAIRARFMSISQIIRYERIIPLSYSLSINDKLNRPREWDLRKWSTNAGERVSCDLKTRGCAPGSPAHALG